MNNTAVISSGGLREKVKTERKQSALLEKLKKSGSLILIAAMFVIRKCGKPSLFNIPHPKKCNEQLLLTMFWPF